MAESRRDDADLELDPGLRAAFRAAAPAPDPPSILDSIAERCGEKPPVLRLRDEDSREDPGFIVHPEPGEGATSRARQSHYQLLGEIGQGGMGIVLKGRDTDLGRDVALKVLRKDLSLTPSALRRFVEEAQIGGQLQHPGIVPVYEFGLMPDDRPYFTMELIRGRTLASLLSRRASCAENLARFLTIFEQACQAVAYAHSRGVVHRDLKPANVMVGAFGEVQVVDWGLAKVLAHGGVADAARAERPHSDAVQTARSRKGSLGSQSAAGSVMGTPNYMPPEQAQGRVQDLDERSDVFSLGAILCEVLTEKPPYVGEREEALDRAERADLADALANLDSCDADEELVALVKRCLSPTPQDRPATAVVLAHEVGRYLGAVEVRARRAQIAAAEAKVKTAEARRAHRLTLALAGSILVTALLGGGGWLFMERQRATRRDDTVRQVSAAVEEATLERGRENWPEALAAIRRAGAHLESGEAAPELRRRVDELALGIQREAEAARLRMQTERDDRALLARLEEVRRPEGADQNYPTDWGLADREYADIFRAHGLALDDLTPEEGVRRIRERSIAVAIAAALDEWSEIRKLARMEEGADRLARIARAADPDVRRERLRDVILGARIGELKEMAATEDLSELPAATLSLLGTALGKAGATDEARTVLRTAARRHPQDFVVNLNLARWLVARRPPEPEEAARCYAAALALRPESVEVRHELGRTLDQAAGDHAAAADVFREAIRRSPGDAHLHWHLGNALRVTGDLDGASAAYRESISLKPDAPEVHFNLGLTLASREDFDGASAEFREVLRLEPDNKQASLELGIALDRKGDFDGAVGSKHEGVLRRPKEAILHHNLGISLCNRGDSDGAIAEYQKAIELDPGYALAHYSLGTTLNDRGDLEGAETEYRKAIELNPEFAEAHCNLGRVLKDKGLFKESLVEYRRGHELGSRRKDWSHSSGEWVSILERLVDLEGTLDRVLSGEALAHDAAECTELAQIANAKDLRLASVRLYAAAFDAEPRLADDASAGHRYDAACAAALAGCGLGRDAGSANETERKLWRARALEWLKEDLARLSGRIESGPDPERTAARRTLAHWQVDSDLRGVRERALLLDFSPEERGACEALWAEVAALLSHAPR